MSESAGNAELRDRIVGALRGVFDPEIPVNLYDLGLIYAIDIRDDASVHVTMTLTTPNCPVAEILPQQVQEAVRATEGVQDASIDLVFEPKWTGDMMTDDAKMQLEMMGIEWSDPHGSLHGGPRATGLTVNRKDVPR